ncbi:MAG: hypothetical protein CUN56_16660, partial [Phototrophicales bacterium]
ILSLVSPLATKTHFHPTYLTMSTNILMVNVHSMSNAGDAVLNHMAVAQLRQNFPDAVITLAINDVTDQHGDWRTVASFFHWMKDGRRWVFGRTLKVLWDAAKTAWRYRRQKSLDLDDKKWNSLL